jgi:hypothetical protein
MAQPSMDTDCSPKGLRLPRGGRSWPLCRASPGEWKESPIGDGLAIFNFNSFESSLYLILNDIQGGSGDLCHIGPHYDG